MCSLQGSFRALGSGGEAQGNQHEEGPRPGRGFWAPGDPHHKEAREESPICDPCGLGFLQGDTSHPTPAPRYEMGLKNRCT